jgi:hypothetical protein
MAGMGIKKATPIYWSGLFICNGGIARKSSDFRIRARHADFYACYAHKRPACASRFMLDARKRLGHTSQTPASATWDGFSISWRESGAKHASLFRGEKKARLREPIYIWCPKEDSNLHTLRHTDLNRARLPIPPFGLEDLC